jgi:hypothetical protein
MAEREGGGTKFMRGLVIALIVVAAIVLLIVFRSQTLDVLRKTGNYVADSFPADSGQRVAVVIFMVLAVLMGIIFSQAGHFTAYGIAMGLAPLLWFLFQEGVPPVGLKPSWASSAGLEHMSPGNVVLWAVVADVIITLVFFPLELREKYQARKHRLADVD